MAHKDLKPKKLVPQDEIWDKPVSASMNSTKALLGLLVLSMVGCKSPQFTSSAPFEANLEREANQGSHYLRLTNVSGHDLHNYTLSVYAWNVYMDHPMYRHEPFLKAFGDDSVLKSGEKLRITSFGESLEEGVDQSITRVEGVGHCNEGKFRQGWIVDHCWKVHPIEAKPEPAKH